MSEESKDRDSLQFYDVPELILKVKQILVCARDFPEMPLCVFKPILLHQCACVYMYKCIHIYIYMYMYT